jgi:hypothetical protein
MKVYNVGDSFTEAGPWAPNEQEHFWYRLAQDLGCSEFVNDSQGGRSNERILKLVLQHLLENPAEDTVYFVNITTIYRLDVTGDGDDKFHDILRPNAIANFAFETVECNLYMQLIGVVEALKARNKQFLVFNNFQNFSQ